MKKKILVVDNYPVMLKFMSKLLEKEGCHVKTAEDGISALEILKAYTPDILFIDLVMPNINGEKLCRIIRGIPKMKDAQIVIISAIAAKEEVDFTEFGANACIAKGPFNKMSEHIFSVLGQLGKRVPNSLAEKIIGIEDAHEHHITKELLSSKRHYEVILDNMSEGIIELNLERKIIFANPMAILLSGITEEDLFTLTFSKIFNSSHRKRVEELIDSLDDKPREITEDSPLSLNGKEVSLSIIPIKEDDKRQASGILAIVCDISERKRAEQALREREERYRTILDSIEQGYYEVDMAGNFTYVNATMCEILGYSENELIGMNNRQYMDQETAKKVFQAFNKVFNTGKVEKGFIWEVKRKDEVKRFVGISVSLVKDSKGHRVGFKGIASDVTERMILENHMAQSQKLESIGQLASGIAHEINTPSQFVGDNAHFLKDAFSDIDQLLKKYEKLHQAAKSGAVTEDAIDEVETALEEADVEYLREEIPVAIQQSLDGVNRIAGIVSAMKAFSHPGDKEKTAFDINKAIESTITVARNEWKYVADMVTDFDPTLPLVPCIAGEFNQVILNMIINAANAISEVVGDGSEEKGAITVSTHKKDGWAEIRITDTGQGIKESIRSKIFDPFFTTKKVGKGTGQGLAIAHSAIVNKHGGTIRFDTEAGKGTTFFINLPIESGSEGKGAEYEEKNPFRR